MKIWTRIFLSILLIVGVSLWYLSDWVVDDLTPQYRESTEEPLVDAARILAAVAAATARQDDPDRPNSIDLTLFRRVFQDVYTRSFSAQIYDLVKTHVDFRVYMTDTLGTVIFDSDNGRAEGHDYSRWRDVYMTLRGKYGARTSRDIPGKPQATVLYIGAPIVVQGETIGVLTIGKPTTNSDVFIAHAKRDTLIGGLVSGASLLLVGLFVSNMITRPIGRLTAYARAVRDGRRVPLPHLGTSEIGQLGTAFEEMRQALEGKQYIENYVQTLTHEIKGPLAAIHGAADLLHNETEDAQEMSPERRAQFIDNIRVETQRITALVEKLLLLSSLENRKSPQETVSICLWRVAQDVLISLRPLWEGKQITCTLEGDESASFRGEAFLVRHAVANLIQNAIDFTPAGGTVSTTIQKTATTVQIRIKDTGAGIPEYALGRIFDRFYSLQRPDTGKKSSGLGLSLVREVVHLHHAEATVSNTPEGGVEATLVFPVVPIRSG